MPSKLAKVQKHVSKKKGSKINSLHENSRDALRLRKASARDDRVSKVNALKQKSNQKWLDRLSFLNGKIPDDLQPLEVDAIQNIIKEFISRNDIEIEQLREERREGRPPSNRQVLLEQQVEAETKEHESGFWLPNFQDAKTLDRFDNWTGGWSSLANLQYVRISSDGGVKESKFPPRGAA